MIEEGVAEPPRSAIRGLGWGLILMGVVTYYWGAFATSGLSTSAGVPVVVVFTIVALVFIVDGILTLISARKLPAVDTAERRRRTRSISNRFYLIFVIEAVLIAIVCVILFTTGGTSYLIPAIALIVGVHLIPLARVFERRIDYYIAGIVAAAAVLSIILIATATLTPYAGWSLASIVAALGTSTYGIYMMRARRRMLRTQPRSYPRCTDGW
jgi:hypothetical protein